MEEFTVKIKALTPIWTGDAQGKNSRLRETGIIGSLRWWYEAVVRGLGGYACDPTGDNRCELSGKEKTQEERLSQLCPACYLFGCGGWKRRFRLEVQNTANIPFKMATSEKKDKFNHWWLSEIFKHSKETKLPFGGISLSFKCGNGEKINEQIMALLSLMAHRGGIGAKNQYGFGQFDWNKKMDLSDAINTIRQFLSSNNFKDYSNKEDWYSLNKFWFYELSLSSDNGLLKKFQKANVIGNGTLPDDYLPVSFDIRYKLPNAADRGLRQGYYSSCKNKHETRKVFGTLENDKIGSRIFVSHLFKKSNSDNSYWLRVWGFVDDSIGKIVGHELKEMFELDSIPSMNTSKELLKTLGGEVQ